MMRRPSVEQAIAAVTRDLSCLASETVPLTEAQGRFLSYAVASGPAQPPFPLSAVNGYALRSSDLTSARSGRPVSFQVVDSIRAGQEPKVMVSTGQAVRVTAGAMLPQGCDAVVRMEDTDGGRDRVSVHRELWPYENFIRRGSDTQANTLLLPAGSRLTAAAIGLLSGLGFPQIAVCRRPRAALLSLGDALVPPGNICKGGQLYASSAYYLRARLLELGCGISAFLFPGMRPEPLAQVLSDCLSRSEIIVTAGGLGPGQRKLLAQALSLLDAEPVFFQVQMEQGESVLFCRAGDKAIFSLPASVGPASLLFELLVPPALSVLTGCSHLLPAWSTVISDLSYPRSSPNRRFLWATLTGDHVTALPAQPFTVPTQGANCLLEIPGGSSPLLPGARLRALVLP